MSNRLSMLGLCGLAAVAVLAAPRSASAQTDHSAHHGHTTQQAAAKCTPVERMPVAGRASAYDSATVEVGGATAKVCYGRPAMKGRKIFGGLVPYDTLWRTGANEPTIIHLPVAAKIAGIAVEPGSYSLYTVPGQNGWTVVVNRSTSQWGHESRYNAEVRAQEVGRARVQATRIAEPVEIFTIRPSGQGLLLEWENTRVTVPITAG